MITAVELKLPLKYGCNVSTVEMLVVGQSKSKADIDYEFVWIFGFDDQ